MTPTAARLGRRFHALQTAIVSELESWKEDDWAKPCTVHGQAVDARRLAMHVARRGSKAAAMVEQLRSSRLMAEEPHSTPLLSEFGPAEVFAALRSAGAATLELINGLTDEEIERLHGSQIDGEPDAIDASCGLVGHWEFHLAAIREVRQTT